MKEIKSSTNRGTTLIIYIRIVLRYNGNKVQFKQHCYNAGLVVQEELVSEKLFGFAITVEDTNVLTPASESVARESAN